MPYDRQFVLLTFNFTILGSPEIANTTLHISGTTAFDSVAALDALSAADLEVINGAMRTLMSNSGLGWANFSKYEGVKAAAKDVTGHDIAEVKEQATATPASGAQTTSANAQDTVVLSLRTATTFGRANFGRMYLPHTSPPRVTGLPYLSDVTTAAITAAGVDFIESVNVVTNAGPEPGAASIMSKAGTGTAKAVTRIGTGNLVDTQRRRRNRIAETYAFANVTV